MGRKPERLCAKAAAALLWFCGWMNLSAATHSVLIEAKNLYKLSREEVASAIPVQIRGIITYCRGPEFSEFVMQDKSAGFIAQLPLAHGEVSPLSPGDEIEIEGVTMLSEGLPSRVAVSRFRKTGVVSMPPPLSMPPAAVAQGGGRYSFIEFTGVIRDAKIDTTLQPPRLVLRFADRDNPLLVRLTGFDERTLSSLVPDTRVVVRGVALAWSTPSLQQLASFVVVQDPSNIEVLSSARPGQELPPTPLATLVSSQNDPFEVRKHRIEGAVTLIRPGRSMMIQQENSAIQLINPQHAALQPGDQVEVSGFPGTTKGRVTLEDSVVSRLGGGSVPDPEWVSARRIIDESLKTDRDSKWIRVAARLRGLSTREDQTVLELESDGVKFEALLPASTTIAEKIRLGSEVAVTGACRILYGPPGTHEVSGIDRFEMDLQDESGVAILSAPSWWTEQRFSQITLGVLGALIAACLGWVFVLHLKTKSQKRLLQKESRALEDSLLLASERSRLAADLHDTLSQTLSGASLQLEATESVEDPSDAKENLALARMLLDRGREELRRAVWDLTPTDLLGVSLEKALRTSAAEFAAYYDCEILISAEENLPELNERTRSHLFRIGQEAIHNAVRHGGASNIGVMIAQDRSEFFIRIADDGCGFDPAKVSGPIQGHFGLSSMRDRALRLKGILEIQSNPSGTVIVARIPLSPEPSPA